jgi:hypothetical protein
LLRFAAQSDKPDNCTSALDNSDRRQVYDPQGTPHRYWCRGASPDRSMRNWHADGWHWVQITTIANTFPLQTLGSSTSPPEPRRLRSPAPCDPAAFAHAGLRPGSTSAPVLLTLLTLLTAPWRSQDPSHNKLSTFNEGPETRPGVPKM